MNTSKTNSQIKLYKHLGLSKSEKKVFECLESEKKISEIMTLTHLPRMTVTDILKRFSKRELVEKIKVDKQKYYTVVSGFKLQKPEIQINEIEKILVHRGEQELFKTWDRLSKNKNAKWYVYQPNNVVAKSLKKINIQKLIEQNNRTKTNKIMTDGYIEKGYVETAKKVIPPELFKSWQTSLQRTHKVNEVSKDVFYTPYEIYMVHNIVYINDWDKNISIEIHQQELVNILKQFFNLLHHNSERIDFNKKLETYNPIFQTPFSRKAGMV